MRWDNAHTLATVPSCLYVCVCVCMLVGLLFVLQVYPRQRRRRQRNETNGNDEQVQPEATAFFFSPCVCVCVCECFGCVQFFTLSNREISTEKRAHTNAANAGRRWAERDTHSIHMKYMYMYVCVYVDFLPLQSAARRRRHHWFSRPLRLLLQ